MKLEDCTKDELIHYLKNRCFVSTDNLELDVLMYRSEIAREKGAEASRTATKALDEYIGIMKPYDGKPIKDIPMSVFKKAQSAFEKHQEYSKKSDRYHREWEKLHKKIDEIL